MFRTVILISILFLCQASHAEIYKWVDAKGKTHFSDKKPENESAAEVKLKTNTFSQADTGTSLKAGDAVVMYSTAWCGYCKKARRYFKKNNIVFTDYDIEKNASAKREYDRIGGKGVPVILVGKKRMRGFSEGAFKALLSQS